jgi:hypothetical protein
VLDFARRVLRRRALHHHEHDVERPDPLGLRSGCAGHAEHVHAGAGFRHAFALLDWNNNYGSHPDKCVCFHCSNLPKHFFKEVKMDFQEIIAGTVGKENTFGTCVGRVKSGAMSYARYSTDDRRGVIRGYAGRASSPTIR